VTTARQRRSLEEERSPGRNLTARGGNTRSVTNLLMEEGLEDDGLGALRSHP
jgi:hypothetical protein